MSTIERFESYLEAEQRCSPHTIEAYGRDLRQLADRCGIDDENIEEGSIATADIRAWIGSLGDQGLSALSLRRKLQSIRAFFRWGRRCGIFESNPAADVTLAKKRRKLPTFVKEDELEDVLASTSRCFAEERSHIIITMLYTLGLRQAELLSLTDADISLPGREIKVTGKRNKQRVIPMPDELRAEIVRWQKIRDDRYPALSNPKPLIAGPHGFLSKHQLYKIVKSGLATTSTSRKSPHTLRHSFATAMINNGADLDAVREMLGHVSLATTQIYTHLSFKDLMDNYSKSHPRGKGD